MPRYAQIDLDTGDVICDSKLRKAGMEKEYPQLIPIGDEFDLANKKWDMDAGEWVEYASEPAAPSQLDRIEEQVNSIASGTTAENTEAIDALLGVE